MNVANFEFGTCVEVQRLINLNLELLLYLWSMTETEHMGIVDFYHVCELLLIHIIYNIEGKYMT